MSSLSNFRYLKNENSDLFGHSLMNSTDDSERTVIHWACSGGRTNIVAWLLNEGVHPDICDSRYEMIG